MNKLYEFCIDGLPVNFPAGVPQVSGDMPATAAILLTQLGRMLPVNCQTLTPDQLRRQAEVFFTEVPWAEGAFLLRLSEAGAEIYSTGQQGCFYAVQMLRRKLREEVWHAFTLYASPRGRRGIKLYLPDPGAAGIQDFCRIIDLAAECMCDFVMLELGGALEYKSHPEINDGWVKYAADMNEYPGKTLKVQASFPWWKNSIHSENGGGKFLTQNEFLSLVDYCRERFLEVIPEMPSLSHSDYLLTCHREMAERAEDPYPDTCCPLHENYHRIYFDLLDEVIELIHPRAINIGHDEFYTVNKCPHCQNLDPVELYANDINIIRDYLAEKGVETFIWGEKLLDAHWQNGEPIGGASVPGSDELEALPAIYPAVEKIKPVSVLHWYWTVNRQLDEVYGRHRLPYIFANLSPGMFKDWSRRIAADYAAGCCVSNWGQCNMRTLQRNGVLYDLVYMSFLMWNSQLDNQDFAGIDRAVFEYLYAFRTLPKPAGKELTVTHTARTDITFQYFFDGFLLDEASFLLGHHVFRSADGEELRFPVIFGSNISNCHVRAERGKDPEQLRDAWVYNLQHTEVAGECLKSEDEDGRVWYCCRYPLPENSGCLEYAGFEPQGKHAAEVWLKSFTVDVSPERF